MARAAIMSCDLPAFPEAFHGANGADAGWPFQLAYWRMRRQRARGTLGSKRTDRHRRDRPYPAEAFDGVAELSRDGEEIAYTHYESDDGDLMLRIAPCHDGTPLVVDVRSLTAARAEVCSQSPDVKANEGKEQS